ncbi:D-sedoheptulose 7-phosphate isomerase [Flavobacteriaceae bacterium]|jgi:D-sedoheptulose 7-phosphate isomerase|nr:D-sedoheptulose 7-phosphate isomerase [Flavobacteriaceae bacterium]MDA9139509.1 D-sedoheptulose 7-phosphate isomerase [Flavobacteriaceae bacterium]|tara:strand:+ start:6673 stop:7266 length:594 start_codon:yes stop_codon:yes gene_type:complete
MKKYNSMGNKDIILKELTQARDALNDFMNQPDCTVSIENAANLIVDAIHNGGKIISCGNGGSMCDAMHFAEELTGRYRENRKPIPALAISDSSHLSCVSNDFGYDQVFSRYVEALGKKGDVLLAISSSGNSKNVIEAISTAKKNGMKTIVLTGKGGGRMAEIGDIVINVPHHGFADRIQEIHIKVIHILILLIEKRV